MKRILFVCTGNTCRSPLAQALLKHKRPDLEVKSAGVCALSGMSASEGTIEVLSKKGILFNHSSQQIDEKMLQWADLVLTLTESHKRKVSKQFPTFVDKLYTLKEYVCEEELLEFQQLLHQHYTSLERIQAQFLNKHKEEIEQLNQRQDPEAKEQLETLSKTLQHLIRNDRQQIDRLERQISSFDISDPFGGTLSVYERTAKEIEDAIEKLITKL